MSSQLNILNKNIQATEKHCLRSSPSVQSGGTQFLCYIKHKIQTKNESKIFILKTCYVAMNFKRYLGKEGKEQGKVF